MIDVGREFSNGGGLTVRVVRIREHAGTVKVWYRRSDGKDISHQISESWMYEDDFARSFTAIEGRG